MVGKHTVKISRMFNARFEHCNIAKDTDGSFVAVIRPRPLSDAQRKAQAIIAEKAGGWRDAGWKKAW